MLQLSPLNSENAVMTCYQKNILGLIRVSEGAPAHQPALPNRPRVGYGWWGEYVILFHPPFLAREEEALITTAENTWL